MSSHGKFYRNVVWQYGLTAVKYLLPFILMPYLTRVLEPQGYAIYAYIASFLSFSQTFIDFGLNLLGAKEVAQAKSKHELNKVIGSIIQARLFLSGVALLVVLTIGWNIPIVRGNIPYLVLMFIAMAGRQMSPDFLFLGKECMAPLTIRYMLTKGCSTVLTLALVRSVADLLWIPVLDIMASAIALAWSFWTARRLFDTSIEFVELRRVWRELKQGAAYCLTNMSSTVFSGFTTVVIGIALTDSAQIAYWSLAMSAISAVQALYGPISESLYPHMLVTGDFSFAKRLCTLSVFALVAGTGAWIALSDVIVLVLGGESYLAGSYVLRLCAPVVFFSFYGIFFGWPVLGARGQVRAMLISTAVPAVFNVVTLCILMALSIASLAAFACVRSVTEFLMFAMRFWFCLRSYKSIED